MCCGEPASWSPPFPLAVALHAKLSRVDLSRVDLRGTTLRLREDAEAHARTPREASAAQGHTPNRRESTLGKNVSKSPQQGPSFIFKNYSI